LTQTHLLDSILSDVYALLHSAIESNDLIAFRAIYEEWKELIEQDDEVKEVLWIKHPISS
jgi:hypothetical protein